MQFCYKNKLDESLNPRLSVQDEYLGRRIVDWQTFRSKSGLSPDASVFYVDDEGSNIPIDSDREFQEALRLARLNKSSLKLVLCGANLKPNDMVYENWRQSGQSSVSVQPPILGPVEKCVEVKLKNLNAVSGSKENVCSCRGDVAPDWFTHYMKKFKRDVIHELKSYIHDTVHSAIEKKLLCTKSEAGELFCERHENPFSPVMTHTRKKKKASGRELLDLIMEQRQLRLSKKLNATKPERLELLHHKTKTLFEEGPRLLESKRKLEKNYFATYITCFSITESASLLPREMCVTIKRESEFTIAVNLHNDSGYQWRSPQLVCLEQKGVRLREYNKYLPKLHPKESCFVEVKGKLTAEEGRHFFKWTVVEAGMGNISPVYTCRFKVVPEQVKESGEVANQLRDSVGTLIDFEKDLISNSQKKIEENINEIERRLHDIELLQPSTSAGKEAKETADASQTGCDLIQLENGLVQEEAKNDCAEVTTPSGLCNVENDKQRDKIPEGIFTKKGESESSDSEVSIVFLLDEQDEEEEDNFFVVPSESLSTAESANEDNKSPNVDPNPRPVADEPTDVRQQSTKPDTKTETPRREETAAKETSQASSPWSLPLRKETLNPIRTNVTPVDFESQFDGRMFNQQPRGLPGNCPSCTFDHQPFQPPKSTGHSFTTANLTRPTFTSTPAFSEGRPPRFTFTGEKQTESKEATWSFNNDPLGRTAKVPTKSTEYSFTTANLTQPTFTQIPSFSESRPPTFKFTGEKQTDPKEATKSVPKTNGYQRTVYAVNSNGRCLPVDELFQGEHKRNDGGEGSQSRQERQHERFTDMPPLNIFPNALRNGATNVASRAFSTAKSVINNLHSAFVTEGKTEMGTPAYEDQVKLSLHEAMTKLCDMGYLDVEKNLLLLLRNNLNLVKVIDELVNQNPPGGF